MRPGLLRRRELAVEIVRRYPSPSVLDVGCGSGRVAEAVLEAGASRVVGVDFSGPMLDLARERLARFGSQVELVEGDFLEVDVEGPFDVVLALGFFDYIRDARPMARRMAELCSGTIVASFPRWTWTKGPIRKLRYEVIGNCPIFDYTETGLRELFRDVGFATLDLERGPSGFIVAARR